MHYRRFVCIFVSALVLFVAGNYAIWKTVTEDLITDRHFSGGDLARMGYLPASKLYRNNVTDLPRRHIPLKEYDGRAVDMVVVGDSFSNGAAGGYNRYYQDYIASRNAIDILNIPRHKDLSPLASVMWLLESGFLRRCGAQYLMLGVSEKSISEMSGPDAFVYTHPSGIPKQFIHMDYALQPPHTVFVNNGNLKYLLNSVLYQFSSNAMFSQVYRSQLDRPLFSANDQCSLLYLRYRDTPAHNQIARLNGNLNLLSKRLREQGVTLIFMPCVDKYNLYYPYLKSAPYASSRFFEELRPMTKDYLFVDTKKILFPLLQASEMDVFYSDDTHWSWKASQKITSSEPLASLRSKRLMP